MIFSVNILARKYALNSWKAQEGKASRHIIKKENKIHVRHLSDMKEHGLDDLFNALLEESQTGWFLEKYIVQHSVLNTLNPSSVNTIRMYVFQNKTGAVSVLGSFLRIGRESSLVDNSSAGGLVSLIDNHTGTLQQAWERTPELLSRYSHPDHGSQIEGTIIPFWAEAKTMGIKTLSALPGTRFAGLDIAITPDGPIMVEVNIQPDVEGLCYMKIQTATVFDS